MHLKKTNIKVPLITLENISVDFLENNVGIHSVKDFFTIGKRPFRRKTILKEINFTINKGESWAIMGRNGSGKSTLLRTISGIIKPSGGKLTVSGTIAPILALSAGMELELTGFENINLLLSLSGLKHREIIQLTREIIDFSELDTNTLQMPVKRYSSGMIARLAFSIALAKNFDILMIDEILAVGDQGFQTKCVQKINLIKEQGKTIIFVSHAPADAVKLCENAILIENGSIKQSGNSKNVCRHYEALFQS